MNKIILLVQLLSHSNGSRESGGCCGEYHGEMRQIKNVYKVSVGKSEEKDQVEDIGVNKRIILK
jgi:hypothetical protein